MPGRNVWINFGVPQLYVGTYIRHINPWKKSSDFMQLMKYLAEPFLRPLKPKTTKILYENS